MKTRTGVFLFLFTLGSLALLAGSWFQVLPFSLTEDLGFITGALTVWLTVVENIWNFPIGIVNELFFIILFWQAGLFADMGLQVLYVILGIQGWYLWLRGGQNKTALRISNISLKEIVLLIPLTILATAGMTFYLQYYTPDTAPFWDALTTVLSLVAQYMLNKKLLQNWFVWISADLIYIPLYIYKNLYLTSIVYVIFLILCIVGIRAWIQSRRKYA